MFQGGVWRTVFFFFALSLSEQFSHLPKDPWTCRICPCSALDEGVHAIKQGNDRLLCGNRRVTLGSFTLCSQKENELMRHAGQKRRNNLELRKPSFVHPAWPALPVKKTLGRHCLTVSLSCEFVPLDGLRHHTTSCLQLHERSDVQSRALRLDCWIGSH